MKGPRHPRTQQGLLTRMRMMMIDEQDVLLLKVRSNAVRLRDGSCKRADALNRNGEQVTHRQPRKGRATNQPALRIHRHHCGNADAGGIYAQYPRHIANSAPALRNNLTRRCSVDQPDLKGVRVKTVAPLWQRSWTCRRLLNAPNAAMAPFAGPWRGPLS